MLRAETFKTATWHSHCDRTSPGFLHYQEFFAIESQPENRLKTLQRFHSSQIFICPRVITGLCYKVDSQTPSLEIPMHYVWRWGLTSTVSIIHLSDLAQQWRTDTFSEANS